MDASAYVYDKELRLPDGRVVTFSSHWAAVAAMIRLSNSEFKSLGSDKAEDLALERELG